MEIRRCQTPFLLFAQGFYQTPFSIHLNKILPLKFLSDIDFPSYPIRFQPKGTLYVALLMIIIDGFLVNFCHMFEEVAKRVRKENI